MRKITALFYSTLSMTFLLTVDRHSCSIVGRYQLSSNFVYSAMSLAKDSLHEGMEYLGFHPIL